MSHNATELIQEAEDENNITESILRDVADVFHEKEGELFSRDNAIDHAETMLSHDRIVVKKAIENLVTDDVDPVIQVKKGLEYYVGVVSYDESDFFYTYIGFNDKHGRIKSSVCAECINESRAIQEVNHYSTKPDAWALNDATCRIAAHYYIEHTEKSLDTIVDQHSDLDPQVVDIEEFEELVGSLEPEMIDISTNVQTGASLLSGTTISGNLAISTGNPSDLNIENLNTNANQGTAPISNGDGTLSMQQIESADTTSSAYSLLNL